MQTTKTSHFTCQQNLSSVYFSRAKFQLVSYNFSLAMIWQITYTHKPPKPCSATLSHVEFSCTVEGPFSWLIFTHLASLMKQINRLRSHLLSYVDLLTFKRSRIFGLSSMICRAAWHLGKICPLIYGCYENSDLENTDLRPPKNSDPWVSRKFRPPEKLRPLGVSKTQTLRKTQTPGCLEKSLGRPPRNTQTPGCLENSDPPKNLDSPKNSDPTLNIFQILQLTIVTEQPLSLSQPPKRMVLQKYLLSENSHWQNLNKTKFLI